MTDTITLSYIETHTFLEEGLFIKTSQDHGLYKIPDGYRLPMSDNEKSVELRKLVNEIIDDKFTTLVSAATKSEIPLSTFKSYVAGTRPFHRLALAKFCIAARISVTKAKELFKYSEYKLDSENILLDAILVYCLQHQESINVMEDELRKKGVKI